MGTPIHRQNTSRSNHALCECYGYSRMIPAPAKIMSPLSMEWSHDRVWDGAVEMVNAVLGLPSEDQGGRLVLDPRPRIGPDPMVV